MSLLMRNYMVSTKYGGGFVQSVNGHSGGHVNGEPVDWFYYVNGVEAPEGAAETNVHRGDAVWWDLHDWSQTFYTPAVVGSFPEPFVHGVGGKRLPVRVECSEVESDACKTVDSRLRALGVPAGLAGLGPAGEIPDTLRVAVAPWSSLRALLAVEPLTRGPRTSGVYARISADGSSIALLNDRGQVSSTLGAGAGLVAALRPSGQEPLWVVTGTTPKASRAPRTPSIAARFTIASRSRSNQTGARLRFRGGNRPWTRALALVIAGSRARCTPRERGWGRCGSRRSSAPR